MKILFELIALALFFVVFQIWGIYPAITVAILAYSLQVLGSWFLKGTVSKIQLVTLGLVIVLGGSTLLFQNELFFKLKPTLLYWAFAVVLIGSQTIGKKPLLQRLGEGNIQLPPKIWRRLNIIWGVFFFALGCLNLTVAYLFATETWVYFKIFWVIGILMAFMLIQFIFLAKHIKLNE